jgi:Homocysteine/selenocysteine methylase (S-methylmethionine-dependent)
MNNYTFLLADYDDIPEIVRLYTSLVGTPGCTWDIDYPSKETAESDIKINSLYILKSDNKIIAVASIGAFDELNDLPWEPENPCELARIGVLPTMQKQGIGTVILQNVINVAKEKGFDGIRMLVSKTNPAALALYDKNGFEKCGEAFRFDIDFYCYQITFNTESDFISSYNNSSIMLTEGAVGQRLEHEYGLLPDKDIMYAALIYSYKGITALRDIYSQYLRIAERYHLPILLMTNTRRANKERVANSTYKNKNIMLDYTVFLKEIASNFNCEAFIGGMMGCKNDAYSDDQGLDFSEAVKFHSWQADMFSIAPIDYMFAGIMPSKYEAMGMAKVMERSAKPYIISLMISRDGLLLDGTSIHDAIVAIDEIVTRKPICYMTNCVHPAILKEALSKPFNKTDVVKKRFCGIQANAAYFEPHKLDNSKTLFSTSAVELVNEFEALQNTFPLKILGGCCGTDNTHIEELAKRFT